MCGIAVIVSQSSAWIPNADSIGRMNRAIVHRGPDAQGIKCFNCGDTSVGLGHQRLSIIDVEGGRQPMSNEDATIWITYNGEIYNHASLRRELAMRGHRFQSRCDTEVVVHAYEEWGPDCVRRLEGMFAFAIWDDRKKQLYCARDRLGIKPFYYSANDSSVVCASEAKSLFASGIRKS